MTSHRHTAKEQLPLPYHVASAPVVQSGGYYATLQRLLQSNLDFHSQPTNYATHTLHAFPAKFPPQLPRVFIESLTSLQDVVMDPMAGSGTTILEAYLAGRYSIAVDIDPLALRVVRAKTMPVNSEQALHTLHCLLKQVREDVAKHGERDFQADFSTTFDVATQKFIRYWFSTETAKLLFYLSRRILSIKETALRAFFEIVFSSIIITKNGGVSLALDLAHTRPHRAKIVYDAQGNLLYRHKGGEISAKRLKILTKRLRPVLPEFEHQAQKGVTRLQKMGRQPAAPTILAGNARHMPLAPNSVDLIITSPPYASNAIDYMRAHKFSLVWFGYSVQTLSRHRKTYIGGESKLETYTRNLPEKVCRVLQKLESKDGAKALVVHRYYTEMQDVLTEMWRVLRPGKAAILVVGTSVLRGIDIQIAECLAAIGREQGFVVPPIGIRNLDRNRRMLPTSARPDLDSQIQQRMHQEFVIGFYKPQSGD